MSKTNDHEYVLGTQQDELARLKMQHELWADVARAAWSRARIGAGMTVMDLGCGPGYATRELAGLVGSDGRVIGVDIAKGFVEHARSYASDGVDAQVEAVHADVQDLELDPASLDAVYTRWVLSFTPEPARVVARLGEFVKPGGVVVIQDYVMWRHLLWSPLHETLESLRRSIMSLYESQGADSSVGQVLPGMLVGAGFEIEEIRPLTRIARPGEPLWAWPTVFFRTFLPKVVAAGHMTQGEYEAWDAEWRALETTPGAFFITPPQVEIISRKR